MVGGKVKVSDLGIAMPLQQAHMVNCVSHPTSLVGARSEFCFPGCTWTEPASAGWHHSALDL